MKKIILLFLIFTLFAPGVIFGADIIKQEFNPLCWTFKDCKTQRAQLGQDSTVVGESFLVESPCTGYKGGNVTVPNDQWGKCLPSTVVTTSIAIGGQRVFKNAPEFIKVVYNFALGAASVLAVIVIMIAGLQWLLSGGNQNTIGASKKRISGAVVGLFIAYTSYFILNTINPALVNLRLPQVYMIKDQKIMSEFCRDMLDGDSVKTTGVALAYSSSGNKIKLTDVVFQDLGKLYESREKDIKTKVTYNAMYCGETYYVDGGGSMSCHGHYCTGKNGLVPEGGLCLASQKKSGTNDWQYTCEDTVLGGRVYGNYIVKPDCSPYISPEGWVKPFITRGSELLLVCTDNSVYKVGDIYTARNIPGDNSSNIWSVENFTKDDIYKDALFKCGTLENTRGFILKLFLDEACDGSDEVHLVGANGKDMGVISRTGHVILSTMIRGPIGLVYSYLYADDIKELKGDFDDSYFIKPLQLKYGHVLNLDVANIPDVD